MAITVSDGTTTIELPDDLIWSDQHSWSPVEQNVSTSLTGASIIDTASRVNGRPITLEGDVNHAWMEYSIVDQLKIWGAIPDQILVLSLRSTNFDVIFRHHEKPAIDVQPVVGYSSPDAQDYFFGSIKFMEV